MPVPMGEQGRKASAKWVEKLTGRKPRKVKKSKPMTLVERVTTADEVATVYYRLGCEALGQAEWDRRCEAALGVKRKK